MDEQEFSDFASAFGEEFSGSLAPVIGWENVVPQDAYEVFLQEFKHDPSPELLASLSDSQMEQMREGFERYLEYKGIAIGLIREAIARTLARWPAQQK